MLIKKEPCSKIRVDKNGEIINIIHFSDGKRIPCIYCKKKTKQREFGSPVCESCQEFGYDKCKQCKYGKRTGVFHCNGNDSEDHFSYYTACAMRNAMQKLKEKPDFENMGSGWLVSPLERKKCFRKKS